MKQITLMLLLAGFAVAQADAKPDQAMANCPMHGQHTKSRNEHFAGVQKRGEAHEGMGFSQTDTTHHFILTPSGGIIQVVANDPGDKKSVEQIQIHFRHIAESFAKGDFAIPHFVHDQAPPGVKTMQNLKHQITYSNESLENGAKLVITTKSSRAAAAVHEFLRFQIKDHQTGDPLTVTAEKGRL